MNLTQSLFFLFLFFQINIYSQNNIKVANISEYNKAIKTAKPGTTIILKNGIWKDVHIEAYGKGTKDKPIVIKAEKGGEVIINGDSKLQIYGNYITIEGLWFKQGKPTKSSYDLAFENDSELSVVSFKNYSGLSATNCRFTNNTISYFNPEDKGIETNWVSLWGKNNRVDHNNFTGKTNLGPTLSVWLKGEEHIENNHLIDANYFGPRPELGRNGGESIKIGTSTYSLKSSKTVVENNTFKNCDGDIEIISNKSCDNIFRNNLFVASKGSLTLRHGKNALVENNVFLGKNISKTGGVRISDEGHIIKNNLLIGLRGRANSSPIAVMHGMPNSPLNGYKRVKNISIQNNTLINCSTVDFATSKDKIKTLAPIQTLFANNLISNTDGTTVLDPADDISGIFFKSNIAETSATVDTNLFTKEKIEWKNLESIPMPTGANKGLISTYSNATTPTKDIVGMKRSPIIVGAFNLDNIKQPKALTLKSGPSWKPNIIIQKQKLKTVIVEPGTGTLYKAIKDATSKTIFQLKDGTYFFKKTRKIDGNVTIIGSEKTVLKSVEVLEKPFNTFFKINENSKLDIKNLTFDGSINSIKYAVVSPSKGKSSTYNLFIDNCNFKNFNHEKGATLRGYTNTTADTISIKNSTFSNSFKGLNYHSTKNDIGKVNANVIIIHNTVFNNIKQYAIQLKKNSDNSKTSKGKLLISNSVFSKVSNSKEGKVISVKEISFIEIKNSVFENSSSITNFVSLVGKNNKIFNCLVNSSGKIETLKEATAKNILYKNPKWSDKKKFIPSKKSFLLKEINNLEDIGLVR